MIFGTYIVYESGDDHHLVSQAPSSLGVTLLSRERCIRNILFHCLEVALGSRARSIKILKIVVVLIEFWVVFTIVVLKL